MDHVSFEMDGPVSDSVMRLMLGGDQSEFDIPMGSLKIESYECPVVIPIKRRGLTGKRYRIARRKYHREMKAWERGQLPGTKFIRVFYHVRPFTVEPIPGDPEHFSVGFSVH